VADLYSTGPTYRLNLEHLRWGRYAMPKARPGSVGDPGEVYFVQTSVNLADPAQTQLIEQLAPVRETMEQQHLGFENLLQRDLDDSRVAGALIPYLLEDSTTLVRMFPSILVLLLPWQQNRLSLRYLPRQQPDQVAPEGGSGLERVAMAYGDGDRKWGFEFSRLKTKAGSYLPYGAHLRVNPQFCRFAIIDGQHRAMALLALWRNLTTWPPDGRPFRDFYANFTREQIQKLDLESLSLPVTLCFFPQLWEGNPALAATDVNVIKYARKLFLDVNRTAKPPSKARQVLLDDVRITSDFVRGVMSTIKDKPATEPGLRLWNLYYDQMEDNESALPKVAVTSVLHIQYMIRMLLLGAKPHQGDRLVTRTDFGFHNPGKQNNSHTLVELLGWKEKFGHDATSWRDETIPTEHRAAAINGFMATWGRVILRFFESLPAFQAIALASAESRTHLETSTAEGDDLVKRMLFEGQGVRSVHDEIREKMDDAESPYPYPEAARNVFKKQGRRLVQVEDQTQMRAAELFWGRGQKPWPNWLAENAEAKKELEQHFGTKLAAWLFKTKAFQVGVIMAIGHIERKLDEQSRPLFWSTDVPEMLLSQLAAYFQPEGFRNAPPDQQAEWMKTTLENHRVGGFVGDTASLYSFVRDTFPGPLQDSKWQFVKYCVMEIFRSRIPEVRAARKEWRANALTQVSEDAVQSLLDEIDGIVDEAVSTYRDHLLSARLDMRRRQHRRDTGHEATDADAGQFWRESCEQLADRLQFSMNLQPKELEALRKRPRLDPDEEVDFDESFHGGDDEEDT
jgi:hypothetical protein